MQGVFRKFLENSRNIQKVEVKFRKLMEKFKNILKGLSSRSFVFFFLFCSFIIFFRFAYLKGRLSDREGYDSVQQCLGIQAESMKLQLHSIFPHVIWEDWVLGPSSTSSLGTLIWYQIRGRAAGTQTSSLIFAAGITGSRQVHCKTASPNHFLTGFIELLLSVFGFLI